MTKRTLCAWTIVVTVLGFACVETNAQLPPNFPGLTVTTYDTNAVGDGYIFLEVTDSSTNNDYYLMMLNNDGTPFWYQSVTNYTYDFKALQNGYLHYANIYHTHSWTGGGDCIHEILDDSYNPEEAITAGNGYVADSHDIQMLPNGHVLLEGYYLTRMNASQYVVGGYPNALVGGVIIQELDQNRNVVFQWRSWDHFTIPTYFPPTTFTNPAAKNPVIDAMHISSVVMDTDGNLLVSNYGMDCWKISRQTGQILWRLGGPANQFSFVGVNPQQALLDFSGHTLRRLDNGDIILYCNASLQQTYPSEVYEWALDETNKIATLVWSYAPPTNYYSWHYGSAQRLTNGNTFIGWGSADMLPGIGGVFNQWIPACSEVTSDGTVVFQMAFNDPKMDSYRAFRYVYPPASQATVASAFYLTVGDSYDFGATGVSMDVNSGGGGYNEVTVEVDPYAPVNPLFLQTAPSVLPVRVELTADSISTLTAQLNFSAASFGFTTPTNLTVYYRAQTGQGLFVPLATQYNPVTGQLQATVAMTSQGGQLGEFIFGYPDVAQVAYPPTLAAVQNYPGVQTQDVVGPLPASPGTNYAVNQQLPICLAWSPNGFAGSYELQIATNSDFAAPVVDLPYQTDAFYVWSNAAPGTTYYYRVNASNDGGTSSWSTGSFQTVPPMIAVTAPNGGEAWRRGLNYFVQWQGNVPEPVGIDLYQGGVFLQTLATNADTGAYRWSIGFNLVPSSNYAIKVRSSTNSALFGMSAAPFSIVDAPVITTGSTTLLPGGSVQFGFTAPGAAQATIWGTTSLSPPNWQNLGHVTVTGGSGAFTNTPPYPFYRVSVP